MCHQARFLKHQTFWELTVVFFSGIRDYICRVADSVCVVVQWNLSMKGSLNEEHLSNEKCPHSQ